MRLILKTMDRVIIEAHIKEVNENGFDFLWDKIRSVYKANKYKIFSVEKNKDKSLIYIEIILES